MVFVVDEQDVLEVCKQEVVTIVELTLAEEGRSGSVEIALVDDAAIAELHERFLDVPGPTDVITFPHEDGAADSVFPKSLGESSPGSERPHDTLGEIVVSTETAVRQAPEYERDPTREVLVYVVHGILHLLGYDDHDDEGRLRMDARQNEILDLWEKSR